MAVAMRLILRDCLADFFFFFFFLFFSRSNVLSFSLYGYKPPIFVQQILLIKVWWGDVGY